MEIKLSLMILILVIGLILLSGITFAINEETVPGKKTRSYQREQTHLNPSLTLLLKFLTLPILLIFILIATFILKFRKLNKPQREKIKTKSKKSTIIAMLIGGFIGALYGMGPWIAGGIFRSWDAIVPFAPSFFTFILLSEGLRIKNDELAFAISIFLWTLFGMLIGFIINKIRR